jgi:hypothetical protein
VPISGAFAPDVTATATGDVTQSQRLPASKSPASCKRAIASAASKTMSNDSPALTRAAASTPPTDSIWTLTPVLSKYFAHNSVNRALVAMDEIPRKTIDAECVMGGIVEICCWLYFGVAVVLLIRQQMIGRLQ